MRYAIRIASVIGFLSLFICLFALFSKVDSLSALIAPI